MSVRQAPPPLAGRVAIVTGASRGIGAAIARRLGALGAVVVVHYGHDAAAAGAIVDELRANGSTAVAIQADVSVPRHLEALFRTTLERLGRVDVVIANAGVDEIGSPFTEVTEPEYDRLVDVNAKGLFFTLQQAARHVGEGGSIVAIGSSTAVHPVAGFGLYGASKIPGHYLAGVLAQELAVRGVTVNTVVPTAIDGAGYFRTATPDDPIRVAAQQANRIGGRMGRVDDVADAVEYLVGPLSRWISGQTLVVAGGAPT